MSVPYGVDLSLGEILGYSVQLTNIAPDAQNLFRLILACGRPEGYLGVYDVPPAIDTPCNWSIRIASFSQIVELTAISETASAVDFYLGWSPDEFTLQPFDATIQNRLLNILAIVNNSSPAIIPV